MKAQDSVTLLDAWDRGAGQIQAQRALILLCAAYPERSYDEWSRVAIGERDNALLNLREELFGTRLNATAECPYCGAKLDLSFSTRHLLATPGAPAQPLLIHSDGYDVAFRLPTSADLLAVASSEVAGEGMLLSRCVTEAIRDGAAVEVTSLSTQVIEAVATAMADADPAADIRIGLTCPACTHSWSMPFDVLAFLWSELDDWAQRLLGEVHLLASAYGWSEREIVALSPRRREFYLNLVGA